MLTRLTDRRLGDEHRLTTVPGTKPRIRAAWTG